MMNKYCKLIFKCKTKKEKMHSPGVLKRVELSTFPPKTYFFKF